MGPELRTSQRCGDGGAVGTTAANAACRATMAVGMQQKQGLPGAARGSFRRSTIMDLVEDQHVPQAARGDAKIITLCGSTRFEAEFAELNRDLTIQGCVVLSLGMFTLPDLTDDDGTVDTSELKARLAGVQFQKIRMADEVFVVDPGGYVGESTRLEIAYAQSLGKPIRYWSSERVARTGDVPPR